MDEIIRSLQEIRGTLECQKKALISIANGLKSAQDERHKRYESKVCQAQVIGANSSIMTEGVNNPGFTRCRIEVAAGFNESSSGGIEILFVYGNSPIGKVMDMISSNGASIYRSEPIDIQELNSFQFQLKNRDKTNSVTITGAKVILYNER